MFYLQTDHCGWPGSWQMHCVLILKCYLQIKIWHAFCNIGSYMVGSNAGEGVDKRAKNNGFIWLYLEYRLYDLNSNSESNTHNINWGSIKMNNGILLLGKCVQTCEKTTVVDRRNQKSLTLLRLLSGSVLNAVNSSNIKFNTNHVAGVNQLSIPYTVSNDASSSHWLVLVSLLLLMVDNFLLRIHSLSACFAEEHKICSSINRVSGANVHSKSTFKCYAGWWKMLLLLH